MIANRRDRTPVTRAAVDQNLLDLGAEAHLAAMRLEQLPQVFGERADAALELGHHRRAVVGTASANARHVALPGV